MKHYQTVDPLQKESQVGRGLFGIRQLLIPHFKFQFSKSTKSTTFPIFLNLTYPLRKKSLSQNAQKSLENLNISRTKRDIFGNIKVSFLLVQPTCSFFKDGFHKKHANFIIVTI